MDMPVGPFFNTQGVALRMDFQAPRDRQRQKSNSQASIRREVFRRDQCCTGCGSTFALETDHRIGKAMGGPSTLENLRWNAPR
jgi:5-methylcytosine-specific restriction endonuclease McrA